MSLLTELAEAALEGARRAPRDFFAPVVGLVRWIRQQAEKAAMENIRRTPSSRSHQH